MESGICTDIRTRFLEVVKENNCLSQTTPHSQPRCPCSTPKHVKIFILQRKWSELWLVYIPEPH